MSKPIEPLAVELPTPTGGLRVLPFPKGDAHAKRVAQWEIAQTRAYLLAEAYRTMKTREDFLAYRARLHAATDAALADFNPGPMPTH